MKKKKINKETKKKPKSFIYLFIFSTFIYILLFKNFWR